jgi:putative transposase
MRIITELIVRMALENPRWGYTRIQGALYNLRHEVGRGTIANVLKREGIEPTPERGGRTSWSVFLKAHWRSIVAADFFTAEVWSFRGLVTYYVLFIIELAKRVVHIAGITTQPSEGWMMQVARSLTDEFDGFLIGKSHLIVDRDTKYTAQFRRLIAEARTAVIRLPPRSPNLKACVSYCLLCWRWSIDKPVGYGTWASLAFDEDLTACRFVETAVAIAVGLAPQDPLAA